MRPRSDHHHNRTIAQVALACLSFMAAANLVIANEIHIYPGESIQAAIDAAADGDEIIVYPGTYTGQIDLQGKAITLRSTDPADPATVVSTILDGGQLGSVITCSSGEGPDTVIAGFVITNGSATNGGGMHSYYSSPTVSDCTFIGNSADTWGGGMCNDHCQSTVSNCTFFDNSAQVWGGGLFNIYSNSTVYNCTFINNLTGDHGGGIYNGYCSALIASCTFTGNTSLAWGGGMFSDCSSPTVVDCTFTNNSAVEGAGGMFFDYYSPIVVGCTLTGNAAGLGGGMFNVMVTGLTVTDCTLTANSADIGGGMRNVNCSPKLVECTVAGNIPDQIDGSFGDHIGNIIGEYPPPPTPVTLTGACCLGDGCLAATEAECTAAAGVYLGDGTDCETSSCPEPCIADITGPDAVPDGAVDVHDLLELLAAWGMCP